VVHLGGRACLALKTHQAAVVMGNTLRQDFERYTPSE